MRVLVGLLSLSSCVTLRQHAQTNLVPVAAATLVCPAADVAVDSLTCPSDDPAALAFNRCQVRVRGCDRVQFYAWTGQAWALDATVTAQAAASTPLAP